MGKIYTTSTLYKNNHYKNKRTVVLLHILIIFIVKSVQQRLKVMATKQNFSTGEKSPLKETNSTNYRLIKRIQNILGKRDILNEWNEIPTNDSTSSVLKKIRSGNNPHKQETTISRVKLPMPINATDMRKSSCHTMKN